MTRLHIIYIFLLLLLFSSCNENFFDSSIDVSIPEHTPQLTVTAHLFDGNPEQFIYVNHSQGILDSTEIRPITDAVVELYEGNNLVTNFSFIPEEDLEGYGIYAADPINFTSEKTYTLKVESTEYGNLKSTQIVPTKVKINTVSFDQSGTIDRYGNRADEISIEFDDPSGERNYYRVSVTGTYLIEDRDTSYFISNWGIKETPVDPIIEEASGILLFSDATLDGNNYTLKFAAFVGQRPPRGGEGELRGITVKLYSVSKDYYFFWKSLDAFENNQNNFFSEPTNVYENVEGGIGIFTLNTIDEYFIEF